MNDSDVNHFSELLEKIVDQNKAVLEAVGDMQRNVALIPSMRDDIAELKQDIQSRRPLT